MQRNTKDERHKMTSCENRKHSTFSVHGSERSPENMGSCGLRFGARFNSHSRIYRLLEFILDTLCLGVRISGKQQSNVPSGASTKLNEMITA